MSRVDPGGTIGIIGAGQLARMMAFEARRMGYRIAVLGPDPHAPAAQIADITILGALDDRRAAAELASVSDVITLDTEHVPADVLDTLSGLTAVRPSADVLRVVQDRLVQRRFLAAERVPQPSFAHVDDEPSLHEAAVAVGFPCVLKTRRSGYDGRGQVRAGCLAELLEGWRALGRQPAVLEAFVRFDREVSVILGRDLDGHVRFYPLAENMHRRHVLHATRVPARVSSAVVGEAEALGARIASALRHVGMLAVELFVTRAGELLVNEIAPRTHNSGHYTFGACATSQFEQHIRAVCGLPLGDTSLLRPALMLNLLGDLWSDGDPDWGAVLTHPTARLHLYGKRGASPGRKMGHILIVDDTEREVTAVADAILARLDPQRAAHPGAPAWT